MKHLALLAAVYALIVALVLPGSLLASEDAAPAVTETTTEPTPTETAEAEPAPVEPAPAARAPAAPAPPEAPAPEAPAPEAQELGDERELARPVATAAQSGSVTITDFAFTPAQITIDQGDTVTWVNEGPTPHSATAPDGSFDTGIFPAGQSRSHTFSAAGTFSYICTPHPNMRGTVVVQASQSDGTGDDAGTGAVDDGTAGQGATPAQTETGPTLPNSGADAWVLFVLGGLMLALGVAAHRRSLG